MAAFRESSPAARDAVEQQPGVRPQRREAWRGADAGLAEGRAPSTDPADRGRRGNRWQTEKRYACPQVRRIHSILDSHVIQKSRRVLATLRAMPRVVLHFLPPYCPAENKIERHWQDLHANVTRNHTHRAMAGLMDAVRAWLKTRYWSHRGVCVG